MVTVRVCGGLGNQLFIYACGYAVAKTLDRKLVLDIADYDNGYYRDYVLDKFKIECRDSMTYPYGQTKLGNVCRHAWISMWYDYIKEKKPTRFQPEIFTERKRPYLRGYWGSYKYFEQFEQDIRRQYTPLWKQEPQVRQIIDEVHGTKNSVAVHVRRGDYLKFGMFISAKYYLNAFKYIRMTLNDPTFYFFSDDIEWTRVCFGNLPEYHYPKIASVNKDLDEFCCISACHNQIIANSTFSWWAAWLNSDANKTIVAPKISIWSEEFYPSTWHLLDAEIAP